MEKIHDYTKKVNFQTYLYNTIDEMNKHIEEMKNNGFYKVSYSTKKDGKHRINYGKIID